MEATVKKLLVVLLVVAGLAVGFAAGVKTSTDQAQVNVSWVPPGSAAVIPVSINASNIDGTADIGGGVFLHNGLKVTGDITGTDAAGTIRYGAATISTTLQTNSISVTTGITGASLALSGAAEITGPVTMYNALGVAGIATFYNQTLAGNGLRITGNVTQVSGSALFATVSSTGTVTGQGIVSVGTFMQYTSGVTQSVITTQPITPTATYMQIAANDADGCFTDNLVRAGALTGQLWILQNIGVPTITITDANTCNLASTYAMAISDTLTLIFDGTSWVEVARSNN
jgi:hypothetical protein